MKSPLGISDFACFFMLVHIRLCSQVYHQIQLGLPPSSRLHIFQNPIFFLFANLTKAILGLDFRPLILPLLRHLYQLCVWFILIQDLRLIFCQDSFWQLKACISMVPRISENRAYFIGKSVMKFRKFKFRAKLYQV